MPGSTFANLEITGENKVEINRDSELFNSFVKNYWNYYRELEKEFISTRKYVECSPDNWNTYSLEYLKLFQTICSEIDVVGKAMAGVCNSLFNPGDKHNNILKWWYEIQDTYMLTDGPFTYMNSSANAARFTLTEYKCCINEHIVLHPWKDFVVQKDKTSKGKPFWWDDYNSVKHGRVLPLNNEEESFNYTRANLGNVCNAIGALYILEKAFMDSVGTYDDLSSFIDCSEIFTRRRRYTFAEMDQIYGNH